MILNIYEYNKYFCVFVYSFFVFFFSFLLFVFFIFCICFQHTLSSHTNHRKTGKKERKKKNSRSILLSFLFVYCQIYKVKIASILEYSGLCVCTCFVWLSYSCRQSSSFSCVCVLALLVYRFFTRGSSVATNGKQISMEIVKMAFQSPFNIIYYMISIENSNYNTKEEMGSWIVEKERERMRK